MYSVVIDRRITDDIKRMEDGSKLLKRMIEQRLAYKAVSIAQKDYLRGQVLNTDTGRLRNSGFVKREGDSAVLGFATKYAAIHEFGGDIYPKRAKALRFQVGGQWIMTKHVKMPKRPYARPAIQQLFNSGLAEKIARGAFDEWARRKAGGK